MATKTKNQPLEIVRNTINHIDNEIREINNLIFIYEAGHGSVLVNGMSESERNVRISVLEEVKERFKSLKEFVIYKA
jgi:hypothetical protein